MGYKRISITRPEEMARLVDAACRSERGTRSEIVRAAPGNFLRKRSIPEVDPTDDDRQVFKRARREHERGAYVTLDRWRDELARHRS